MQKTVNGVATNYTLHGKNVVHITRGNDDLHFFYDAQNRPAVVVYNGTPYSYVKNLQSDIVALWRKWAQFLLTAREGHAMISLTNYAGGEERWGALKMER